MDSMFGSQLPATCLPYGCGYLRRISILKPSFVLDIEKGIVRPKKDLDKIRTVSIQISV